MSFVNKMKERVLSGGNLTKEDAMKLYRCDLTELTGAANNIRKHFCRDVFDICTIINAKSGRCSEDCKFCAQSAHFMGDSPEYSLLEKEDIFDEAKINQDKGVLRYSLVTSGRKLTNDDVDKVSQTIKKIDDELDIKVCGSFGLIEKEEMKKLKDSGLTRIHCNLETSRRYFPFVCNTHTYDDKLNTINTAKELGIYVCSGGIMGLGESLEDRIDMAIELRDLGVKSIPVNFLNPIEGTPFSKNTLLTDEEKLRIIAVYRFLLPDAYIRLAGGRGLIEDKGLGCFISGANAAISGDMLTTAGISVETDMEMVSELGFEVRYE